VIQGKLFLVISTKDSSENAEIALMKYLQSQNDIPKIFAVVAAFLILPGLALAGTDNGKGNGGQNNGNQYGKGDHGDPSVSSVPEANPGIVLIPFVGTVLLVSWLQFSRMKAQKSDSLS
jgi:hypothetical protein